MNLAQVVQSSQQMASPVRSPSPAPTARSPASPTCTSLRLEQAGSTPGGTPLWKKVVDDAAEGVAPGKPT